MKKTICEDASTSWSNLFISVDEDQKQNNRLYDLFSKKSRTACAPTIPEQFQSEEYKNELNEFDEATGFNSRVSVQVDEDFYDSLPYKKNFTVPSHYVKYRPNSSKVLTRKNLGNPNNYNRLGPIQFCDIRMVFCRKCSERVYARISQELRQLRPPSDASILQLEIAAKRREVRLLPYNLTGFRTSSKKLSNSSTFLSTKHVLDSIWWIHAVLLKETRNYKKLCAVFCKSYFTKV